MMMLLLFALHWPFSRVHQESGMFTIREHGTATIYFEKQFTKPPACSVTNALLGTRTEKMFQIRVVGKVGTLVTWQCKKK